MENRRQASAKRYQHKKVLRAKEAVRRSVEREKEETIRQQRTEEKNLREDQERTARQNLMN